MDNHSDLKQEARDHVADLADDAKTALNEKATQKAEDAQSAAAEKIQQSADAASAAAAQFDPNTMQAEAARQIADRIEGIASHVRSANVTEIVQQTSDFARRNPALFIGAAAVVGFAATRFLKAQPHQRRYGIADGVDPWADGDEAVGDRHA